MLGKLVTVMLLFCLLFNVGQIPASTFKPQSYTTSSNMMRIVDANISSKILFSNPVEVFPDLGGIIVYSSQLASLSGRLVNINLTEDEYIIDSEYTPKRNGSLLLLSSEGNLYMYDAKFDLVWSAYFSFPKIVENITFLDIYGDDDPEIIVWGQGSKEIFVLSLEGYPLGEISIDDSSIIKALGNITIREEKYLLVAYYDLYGNYQIAIISIPDGVLNTFSVLADYFGEPGLAIDLMSVQTTNDTKLYVASVMRDSLGNVTLECFDVLSTDNVSLEFSKSVGYSDGWVKLTRSEQYPIIVASRRMIYASNYTCDVVMELGTIYSAAVSGKRLIVTRTPKDLSYEKYISLITINENFSVESEIYLGTSNIKAQSEFPYTIVSFDNGAKVSIYNLTQLLNSKCYAADLHIECTQQGVIAYNDFGIFVLNNNSARKIYETENQIISIKVTSTDIIVLERVNDVYYKIVSTGSHQEVEFSIIDANITSFGEPINNTVPIGILEAQNSTAKIIFVDMVTGNITSEMNISFVPTKIVSCGELWLSYEAIEDRIYAFNVQGLRGMKFLEDNLVVDLWAVNSQENLIIVKTIDTLHNYYNIIVLGEHLETLLTVDNVRGDPAYRFSCDSLVSEIFVLTREHGLSIVSINVSDMSTIEFSTPESNLDFVSWIYNDSPYGLSMVLGAGILRLIKLNYSLVSIEFVDIDTHFSDISIGIVNGSLSWFVGLNSSGVYIANVYPIIDEDFPTIDASISGINIYGNVFVSLAQNFSMLVTISDDQEIEYSVLSISILNRNNETLYSDEIEAENFTQKTMNYSIIPPNGSYALNISIFVEDIAGRGISLEYWVFLDWKKPTIEPMFPQNATSTETLMFMVYDDVLVKSVYAMVGDEIIPLEPVEAEISVGKPRMYMLREPPRGRITIIAVDYVGRAARLVINLGSFSSSTNNAVIIISVFGVGVMLGFILQLIAPRLRKISSELVAKIRGSGEQ